LKIDALDKKIEMLKEDIKFYRTLLFALLSGMVWTMFALIAHKVESDILILDVIGNIFLIYVGLRIKFLKKEQDNLIDELERIE
jgi:threonine/homoserine/homoserine lactone efflux protein